MGSTAPAVINHYRSQLNSCSIIRRHPCSPASTGPSFAYCAAIIPVIISHNNINVHSVIIIADHYTHIPIITTPPPLRQHQLLLIALADWLLPCLVASFRQPPSFSSLSHQHCTISRRVTIYLPLFSNLQQQPTPDTSHLLSTTKSPASRIDATAIAY